MTFAKELKKWRGDMRQKNACDVIGIPLPTFKAWEQGVNKPNELSICEARWRMAAFKKGEPLQVYKAKYLAIIQQVAQEIITKPKSKTP